MNKLYYRIIGVSVFMFTLVAFIHPALQAFMGGGDSLYANRPGPMLLYPTTDDIDLGGKDSVEFKWERTDSVITLYYDFRLYKGRQATADNLILQKKVYESDYPVSLPSSTLEENQVYTWVVRQVFNNGMKSDKSYSPFMIKKK